MAELYGKPVEVSNNGRLFVFQDRESRSVINILELAIEYSIQSTSKIDNMNEDDDD